MLRSPIGWAWRFAPSCLAPIAEGHLRFNQSGVVADSDERQFPTDFRFDYSAPRSLSSAWPQGDWCSSLEQKVFEIARRWAASSPRDLILSDRREAGRAAAASLQKRLRSAGLATSNLTVRFIVPNDLDAARTVPEIARHARAARPVIFIGLDGADWTLLETYMRAGLMPNLAALVREGRSGTLKTQHPPLSPLLWNTMMTGVGPLEHGILDFTRFHPESRAKEPITADERQVPAIWNMATRGGKSVAVFGLWATYPAEPVRGLMVSDRFFSFLYTEEPPAMGVVFPPMRESWARDIRVDAEKSVGFARIREYLPWLTETEFQSHLGSKDPYAHPVSALHRILLETEVYDTLAGAYLSARRPDLSIIYFQGTDSIGHVFAPYNPPRQPNITEQEFAKYKDVAARYFQYVDSLLGRYRNLAGQRQAVLMIASDHGFKWHEGRPAELSSFAAPTAAKWHRDEGIYLLWGESVVGGRGADGNISQVCSTLLSLAGLPSGKSLAPGLAGVPRTDIAVDYQPHYRPVAVARSAEAVSEEIAKLRALGYIGATEATTAPPGSGATRTAGSYNNEGLILRNQGREREATAAFETALTIDPNVSSAAWNLSDLLHKQKRDLDRSDDLLVRAFANGLPEGRSFLIGRAIGYQRSGQPDRSLRLLESAVEVNPSDAELRMFRGRYRIDRGECAGALEDFRAAQQLTPANPIAFASAGIAEICLGNRDAALAYFRRALEIEPDQPKIRAYLRSLQ